MTDIWFTSDTHFYHKNAAERRGLDSIELMNKILINNWNSCVKPEDHIYVVGDFCWKENRLDELMPQLQGHMHLVVGNHDHKRTRKHPRWESVKFLEWIHIDKQQIVMCHYPMITWPWAHKGSWHLYGHCHGNLVTEGTNTRMDVGVDANNFLPLRFDEIRAIMQTREYEVVDHHGRNDE